jgi:uncharacterized OB-fold protein
MDEMHELAEVITNRQASDDYEKPLPEPELEPPAKPFWEGLRKETFLLQHCEECGEYQYFPRSWCHFCGSEEWTWEEASGEGTIVSYTVVRQTIGNPDFSEDIPYVVAYAKLAEGPKMYSNVMDCDPDDVEIGLDVEVVFDHVTADVTLPRFVLADESGE